MTNHAMGSDQLFWLSFYIIFPLLCIAAFATGSRALCRSLAVALIVSSVSSAIYYGIGSVLNSLVVMVMAVGLAATLWVRSMPKIDRRRSD